MKRWLTDIWAPVWPRWPIRHINMDCFIVFLQVVDFFCTQKTCCWPSPWFNRDLISKTTSATWWEGKSQVLRCFGLWGDALSLTRSRLRSYPAENFVRLWNSLNILTSMVLFHSWTFLVPTSHFCCSFTPCLPHWMWVQCSVHDQFCPCLPSWSF